MLRLSGKATGHQYVHRVTELEVSGVLVKGQATSVLTALAVLVKTPFRKICGHYGSILVKGSGEAHPTQHGNGGLSEVGKNS